MVMIEMVDGGKDLNSQGKQIRRRHYLAKGNFNILAQRRP